MSEKKKSGEAAASAGGPFAVFEAHAVQWFGSLEDADAHVAELMAHRGELAGEPPVVAKPV